MTALAAGCAVAGGGGARVIARNAGDLPIARTLEELPVTPAAWPATDWWTAVGDPQLDALMAEGLQGAPDLAMSDARARAAAAQAEGADARRYPVVSASAGYTGVDLPASVAPAPIGGGYADFEDAGLRLSFSPDLWGGDRAAWQAALGEQRAAEVDAQAARVTLSINLASEYAALGYAFDLRDVAEGESKRAQALLDLTRQRVAAGIDSQLQVKDAESVATDAEQALQAARSHIDSARIALAALLGAGPDRGLAIKRPATLAPAALALPSVVPAELLGRRADLVAARWRVEAAAKQIKAARAEFYPNINLAAAVGLLSMGADKLLEASSRAYQLGPAISLPIFDGGRLRSNLAARNAAFDEAVASYNQLLVNALRDVGSAVANLRALDAEAGVQQKALETSWEAYGLSLQRYRSGVANDIEALGVQRRVLQDERSLAMIHLQQLGASLALVQGLGGGYREAGPQAAPAVSGLP